MDQPKGDTRSAAGLLLNTAAVICLAFSDLHPAVDHNGYVRLEGLESARTRRILRWGGWVGLFAGFLLQFLVSL